jgi:hypothetical protein
MKLLGLSALGTGTDCWSQTKAVGFLQLKQLPRSTANSTFTVYACLLVDTEEHTIRLLNFYQHGVTKLNHADFGNVRKYSEAHLDY